MIIDHFSQDSDRGDDTVAYVYIKGEDKISRESPNWILSVLIKQLCWKLNELPSNLLDEFRQCRKDARIPILSQLAAMLMACVKNLGRVFLVLDGLDECEQTCRTRLLEIISTASLEKNVKALVFSRWERDIERVIYRANPLMISKLTSDKNDIAKVVGYRVKKDLGHLKDENQQYVIDQLIKKSGGM